MTTDTAPRTSPRVSLCIPAYQAERHLRATLDSVLAQTYDDIEIVVVDNNSDDHTGDILASVHDRRVRVLRNTETLPIAENFNRAVTQSRGHYVKLICADDTLEPDCIAQQVGIMDAHPGVALVSVKTDFIDDVGDILRPGKGLRGIAGRQSAQRTVRRVVRSGTNPIGPPVAALFRRSDFDLCGGFNGDLPFPMELDLWVRLIRHGDFYGLPKTLASFRIGSGSMTALTSARSQLGQQIEFVRRLVGDPRWRISTPDRVVGFANMLDKQVRRDVLFLMSSARASRRCRAGGADAQATTTTSSLRPDREDSQKPVT
ncbi:glycosyltransferase [Mycobacterium sp. NPDC006124]|uniref:glycosyltransferase n=1 Tax=Mycobacterium sp. NPDC006124 TaxID=3156729 RepID=UPI0033A36582